MPMTRPLAGRAALGSAALLSLLLALAACDRSSSPSAASLGPSVSAACGREEIADGGIDGSVVDSEGTPLADIFVLIETADGFRGTTRTGEDGAFTAPGVSGAFTITTTDIAHDRVVREVVVPCGELVEVELVLTPVDG